MRYLAQRPSRSTGALLDFPRSVDDLFTRFWGGVPALRHEGWQPPVDVIETPQAYLLRLDIPGIDPQLVDVTLTGDVLTVRGEKQETEKVEGETWRLSERQFGSFERVFTLPSTMSASEIEAQATNGVLTIRVMKAKEAQPQRIAIKNG
jgi:HSP20 family protein